MKKFIEKYWVSIFFIVMGLIGFLILKLSAGFDSALLGAVMFLTAIPSFVISVILYLLNKFTKLKTKNMVNFSISLLLGLMLFIPTLYLGGALV